MTSITIRQLKEVQESVDTFERIEEILGQQSQEPSETCSVRIWFNNGGSIELYADEPDMEWLRADLMEVLRTARETIRMNLQRKGLNIADDPTPMAPGGPIKKKKKRYPKKKKARKRNPHASRDPELTLAERPRSLD
jgi:hypothetical protein